MDINSPSVARRKDLNVRLHELNRVRLTKEVSSSSGVVPPGSMGTIVHSYAGGNAFEVEFEKPRHMILTLESSQIEPV